MNPFDFKFRIYGPVAWCNRCSRKHPRRMCDLVEHKRHVPVRLNKDGTRKRGGHYVTRLVHPGNIEHKHVKKHRARRN